MNVTAVAKPSPPDFSTSIHNPAMMEAALALFDNRLSDAEPLLRTELKANPFNVAAMRMLAELAGRIGRLRDAENLLTRAVELAPGFIAARSNLATVLHRQNRSLEAIAVLDALAEIDPDTMGGANLRAAALGRLGDYDEALAASTDNSSTGEEHKPFVRDEQKVGRNDPCPCGSGKKYKQCHGQLS